MDLRGVWQDKYLRDTVLSKRPEAYVAAHTCEINHLKLWKNGRPPGHDLFGVYLFHTKCVVDYECVVDYSIFG